MGLIYKKYFLELFIGNNNVLYLTQILNLFLALLLNSFSGDVLQGTENQQNSITAAFSLTQKWFKSQRKKFQYYDFRVNMFTYSVSKLSPK